MQGAELNVMTTRPFDYHSRFKFLVGFRYWNFDDHLTFYTNSPNIPGQQANVFFTQDTFHTENNFYGGQIGAQFDYDYCSFFFNVKGKVALGAICQETVINGELVTNNFDGFGASQTFKGGYFALPTNIGHHKKKQISVIPEVNVNIGYQFADCVRFQVGYTFLYVTNVLRATKQIDRSINPSQSQAISDKANAVLVGIPRPKARLRSDSLWTQGVSAGFEFQF